MNARPLRAALVTISRLIDRASQVALSEVQLDDLYRSVEVISNWPAQDPCFPRALGLRASLNASGILSASPKRPTFPEQLLSECSFLMSYLDSRVEEDLT